MNKLERIDDFRQVLKNYKLSKSALLTLGQTELVLLIAATSSGRNTILRELLRTGDYYYLVSDTTRQPRENDGVMEQDGREYWFREESELLGDLQQGKFLEAAIIHNQQVSGISIRELEKAQQLNKIAITDAETGGADTTTRLKPGTICIFVLPPSFDAWQQRLHHRGHMDSAEYKRRMASAASEFEAALAHDYYRFVINDTVEHAVEQVNHIAKLDQVDAESQQQGRALAERLLLSTRQLLAEL